MDASLIPPDIRMALLLRANYEAITAMCATSTEYNEICNNWYFWLKKIQTVRPNFDPNRDIFPISRLKKLYQLLEHPGTLYILVAAHRSVAALTDNNIFIALDVTRPRGPEALEFIDIFGNVYDLGINKDATELQPRKITALSNIMQISSIKESSIYLNDQGNVFVRTQDIIETLNLSNIVYITAGYGYIYAINNLGKTYKYDVVTKSITEINKSFDSIQIIALLLHQIILDKNGRVYVIRQGSTDIFDADVLPLNLPKIKMIDGSTSHLVCLGQNGQVYIVDLNNMHINMIETASNIVEISHNMTTTLCIDVQGEVYIYNYGSQLLHHIENLHHVTHATAMKGDFYGLLVSS